MPFNIKLPFVGRFLTTENRQNKPKDKLKKMGIRKFEEDSTNLLMSKYRSDSENERDR